MVGWFYWEPTRESIGVVSGFEEDGLDQTEIEQLIDTFPSQSIDFWCFTFTGLRRASSRVIQVGLNKVSVQLVNNPEFTVRFRKSDF